MVHVHDVMMMLLCVRYRYGRWMAENESLSIDVIVGADFGAPALLEVLFSPRPHAYVTASTPARQKWLRSEQYLFHIQTPS